MNTNTLLLLEMDASSFTKLAASLNKNGTWKTIADFLEIFDQNEISLLSHERYPGNRLLEELVTKLCTIQTLRDILRKCGLYEALSIISEPEPLTIIKQVGTMLKRKQKLNLSIGELFELEFQVSGIPPPTFTWFKDGKILLDKTSNFLRYDTFVPQMEGEYYCCATQTLIDAVDKIYSDTVRVETLPIACVILEKPDEFIYICRGSPIILQIKACGYPKPSFQWQYGNTILDCETSRTLYISTASEENSGEYRCRIVNIANEIIVKSTVVIYEENVFPIFKQPVSGKIALLIANDTYNNLNNLHSPSNDVATLAEILQPLGFRTMCLQNLNRREIVLAINRFADLIQEESFAFFYYAGHGFELDHKYLLPVDCSEPKHIKKAEAVSESFILQKMLAKGPILFICLLDMCLKMPDRCQNPEIYMEESNVHCFTPNRNLIRGYSTISYLGAYEKPNKTNGIYVNILKQYLSKDLSFLKILGKVNADMAKECCQQMPQVSYIVAQDFYLNTPLKGLFYTADLFEKLNIKSRKIQIGNIEVDIEPLKNVFNNSLEITFNNVKSIKYKSDNNGVTFVRTNIEGKMVLIVGQLQKMGSENLNIKLILDDVHKFEINKSIEIALVLAK